MADGKKLGQRPKMETSERNHHQCDYKQLHAFSIDCGGDRLFEGKNRMGSGRGRAISWSGIDYSKGRQTDVVGGRSAIARWAQSVWRARERQLSVHGESAFGVLFRGNIRTHQFFRPLEDVRLEYVVEAQRPLAPTEIAMHLAGKPAGAGQSGAVGMIAVENVHAMKRTRTVLLRVQRTYQCSLYRLHGSVNVFPPREQL